MIEQARHSIKKQVAPFHRIDLYVIFLIVSFLSWSRLPVSGPNGSCNDF